MAIQDNIILTMDPFWDEEFKSLDYKLEVFNDADSINKWLVQGYPGKFLGQLCDMSKPQPSWNYRFVEFFSALGWKDIGTSYYRMTSGTILPNHSDRYKKYIDMFKLQGKEHTIYRALILLEDWKSGHYLEVDNVPIVNWKKGNYAIWNNDLPHLAANCGLEDRYTLQITGHIPE